MAHMIEEGKDHVALGRGIKAWHGLGTVIDGLMSPLEAILHAKLGWSVSLEDLMVAHPDLTDLEVPARAVIRDDTKTILGVVGTTFRPVQNTELVCVLDAMVENGAKIDSAGSLFGGKIVWFSAKLGDPYDVNGDQHVDYLLLSHGHDGSRSVRVSVTRVRVVCWNTLQDSDLNAEASFSIRHTESAKERIAAMGKLMSKTKESREAFIEAAKQMKGKKLGKKQQFDFICEQLGLDPETEMDSARRKIEAAKSALEWERNAAQKDAKDTAWTAFQAVTNYLEHETASKGADSDTGADRRFVSSILPGGERAILAQDAFASALDLAMTATPSNLSLVK